jgi:hypothetical protein
MMTASLTEMVVAKPKSSCWTRKVLSRTPEVKDGTRSVEVLCSDTSYWRQRAGSGRSLHLYEMAVCTRYCRYPLSRLDEEANE